MPLSTNDRLMLAPVVFVFWSMLLGMSNAAGPDFAAQATSVVARPEKPGSLRTWTRSDGSRSQAARLIKYDALSGNAHFERADGRTATTQLSRLCEEDRQFVAAELGDAPLAFAGPGISPPPAPPASGNRAGRESAHILPLVLVANTSHGADRRALRSRGAQRPSEADDDFAPRLVTLAAVKQPGELEVLPTPDAGVPQPQPGTGGALYVWPRVAFYGCRGTWHLIDGMGTASYRHQGQWWLTALKRSPSPAGWWYYQENPTLNNTGRFWAFKLWKTPCGHICGHGCGGCAHACGHHHHHVGFEVWLWHQGHWYLHDCAHVVRMLPFATGTQTPI